MEAALQRSNPPQPPLARSDRYEHELVKRLLEEAEEIYNNKTNPQRHWQSLNLTYEGLLIILNEEPLITEEPGDSHSRAKLELLAKGLRLWDKNSAWLGVVNREPREPLSTLRITAYRMWIYQHGLRGDKRAVQIVSTLAYALMGAGRWAGAMKSLQWALQQDVDEAAKRDLLGALVDLLTRLQEHEQVLEEYDNLDQLAKHLGIARDAKAHRQGTKGLSMLRAGKMQEGESSIREALNELTSSGHVGFHLQLLWDLVDYCLSHMRIDDAERIVSRALQLLEGNPASHHNHRRRFEELKEFLDTRDRLHQVVSKTHLPLYELIATAEEALVHNKRISGTVLLVTALETITLAMWLARKQDILAIKEDLLGQILGQNRRRKRRTWQLTLAECFPDEGEWQKLEEAPSLDIKNRILHALHAYHPTDARMNDAMFGWIDALRHARNKIAHGHPSAEEIRYTTFHVGTLYTWYKNAVSLLERAHHDIHHYYRNLL